MDQTAPMSRITGPTPSRTNIAAADAALDRLEALEAVPVHDHVEIYDDVQRMLHDGLAELDDS
jgi:hypothetical protein